MLAPFYIPNIGVQILLQQSKLHIKPMAFGTSLQSTVREMGLDQPHNEKQVLWIKEGYIRQ